MKKIVTLLVLGMFIAGFGVPMAFAENTIPTKVQKEGLKQGLKNGTKAGLKYGLKDGLKNGLKDGPKNGQVNGAKKIK